MKSCLSTATFHDETISRCPECGSFNLLVDERSGEVACVDCGFVIVPVTADLGPEWREFDGYKEEKRSRAGAPVTLTMHDKGLSTKIGWQGRRKGAMTDDQLESLQILRKWDKRTQVSDSIERNLSRALSELNSICSTIGVPATVAETASSIYRRVLKHKLMRGRSLRAMAAASIYLACRQCGVARMLHEISKATSLSKKEVGRCYRFVVNSLEMPTPQSDLKLYISRFVNNLELKGDVEELALRILDAAKDLGLTSGRGPVGLAAASTYLASVLLNYRKTQREVAETAKVTEVTIRNRYKELLERIDIKLLI